ncbi:PTS sugar transporter subunit IIA [Paraoerskovia sediminicola]|uniref:Phosphocarrier protein HPr n=1 Tax=Paraoerskovia sediminicola TaxID=1138587 RepID=A0ABN6XGI1_9CELL|nr:HPr family phosphocarrier protein [Paraoerskovia sediminicola]BDZ43962.1 PTS sugar transporter subunit IIA [Paraoerskovia sediminicola]
MSARVAVLLVSHSPEIARGLVDLAGQMAPGVRIVGVGGTDDGRFGTDYDGVRDALGSLVGGDGDEPVEGGGVVVLADLGSAVLTVESVLDAEDHLAPRTRLVSAPFVEGAVAAAVTAHGGGDVAAVAREAAAAGATFDQVAREASSEGVADAGVGEAAGGAVPAPGARTAVVPNPMGLHARPAALLARMIAALGVRVTIDGVDGASVLQIMKLGATQGRELTIEATGEGSAAAIDRVVAEIEGGFGEV